MAAINLLSLSISTLVGDEISDYQILRAIKLAKRTATLIEDIEEETPVQTKKHNTADLFKDYPWNGHGAMRKDLEAWLKKVSGYTSNRAMQTIITNALNERIIYKNLKTRKYHPGDAFPTAKPSTPAP